MILEVVTKDKAWNLFISLMVQEGLLKVVDTTGKLVPSKELKTVFNNARETVESWPSSNRSLDPNGPPAPFTSTAATFEGKIEDVARAYIGTCEPRKDWEKSLREVRNQYGADEVLGAFTQWAISQGGLSIRKPVAMFIRNAGSYISSVSKPAVVSDNLVRVEEKIAYITDNKVFFRGDYRFHLARAVNTHDPEYVIKAFEQFFQDVDEKRVQWAAKDFVERVDVMVAIIKRKEEEGNLAKKAIEEAYKTAHDEVKRVEEEREDI